MRVLGSVDDLTELYGRARVFIAHTRFAAGIPFKLHHASAHGLLNRHITPMEDASAVSPDAGNSPVRFDVAGARAGVMESPKRARSRKRRTQPRGVLHNTAPVPDPTAHAHAPLCSCLGVGCQLLGKPLGEFRVELLEATHGGCA